jgi:predicted DNA-binding protein
LGKPKPGLSTKKNNIYYGQKGIIMKTLASFRLPEKTREKLKNLGEKYDISQAELIETMCDFLDDPDVERGFALSVNTWKTEKKPAFRKFKEEYDKLSLSEKKIMREKLLQTTLDFDE